MAGVPAHVVQRGNNRQAVFFNPEDFSIYLNFLGESANVHGCLIHAYVLMRNHIHLMLTPKNSSSISTMIQQLGRRYVAYVNRRYGRSGTLWEGRHSGSIIDAANFALRCCRYIELNPVRSGVTKSPAEYRWSSYHGNADGENPLLAPLPQHEELGDTFEARQKAYRQFLQAELPPAEIELITRCARAGTALGSSCFKQRVERELGVKMGHDRRGRPAL